MNVETIIADLRAEADRWNDKSMVPGTGDDLRRRYRKLHEELRRLANKYEVSRVFVPPPDPTATIIAWLRDKDGCDRDGCPIGGDQYVARSIADAIEEGAHLPRTDTSPCLETAKTDPPPPEMPEGDPPLSPDWVNCPHPALQDGRCLHCGVSP